MRTLPEELQNLITSGPMAHLTTLNPDGRPQVSVIWIGLEDGELVSGHMSRHLKLRNIARDPYVVLSFVAPHESGAFLNPYAVLHARAVVEASDHTWDLLDRLAKVYTSPDAEFPGERANGYIVRYSIERIGGVGPWGRSR
jgi:PPOX class probable F420-dependent enzyme